MQGRRLGYPLGRLLGGSSGLNTQAFVPAVEIGLDAWKELGNPGWDWKSLAPYYKKTYSLKPPSQEVSEYLGLKYLTATDDTSPKGPIQCGFSGSTEDLIGQAWIKAFKSIGYDSTEDLWVGAALGGYAHATTVNPASKTRSYSASDYYDPVRSRKNLRVVTGCYAQKIIFEKTNQAKVRASGVLTSKTGESKMYHARKEVILAAGALNSPKLLELSGVGNPSILTANGIDVVVDNSHVGENFQDHPSSGISFEVREGIETLDGLNRQEPAAVQAAMQEYQSHKKGPFSAAAVNYSAVLPVMDFVRGRDSQDKNEVLSRNLLSQSVPQSLYLPLPVVNLVNKVYASDSLGSMHYFIYAAQGNFGSDSSQAKNVASPLAPGNFVTIAGFLSYPLSRGSVHIQSSDPAEMPVIDAKLLDHPLDVEMFARQIRFIEEIAKSDPLASVLKPGGRIVPDFAALAGDLEKTKAYLRRTVISAWHPCGTCAMRPRQQGGVLDPSLTVYGTDNVRIVDASMMPLICRGNTQSTVYAVAEKAADLIKAEWNLCQA